ncbi:YbaB/EbfC family nucleoid-associated protein [uncultured Microbacterium sp.]|uniref:YbaB/EbfC family nucleoid-associated protein n=1 Tax=uncultured Microbacterium sp. TaxID=191216 RepID=UPI0028F14CBD|nr:YbaB/EbfC family nucleoid-associated protein [uncultured Microbacterium sp.]
MNAKIDAQIARSRELAEEAARVSAAATQTTATVTSSDGRVTVVAQPTGAIAEVRLSSAIDDAIALGATITDTIAAAQRAAADAVVESLAKTLGADSGLVDAVRRDVQVAFPAPGDDTLGYR